MALLERDWRPRILLVGDVMLDRYLWGDVERISPEAPIPVLRVGKQEHRLGGAGSVASMVASLGARTMLAAVVGDDAEGRTVAELLAKLDVDQQAVLTLPDRCTTVKERLLGRAQQRYPHQMMRVDRETDAAIPAETIDRLLAAMAAVPGTDRPGVDQRLQQGRVQGRDDSAAGEAGPRGGRAGDRRSGPRRRLSSLRRLRLHYAQSPGGGAGRRHEDHHAARGPGGGEAVARATASSRRW